jgi:nitrous oxide reductase accessory protein NosL
MLVDERPRWIAGLNNAAGKQQRFCSPRCMFAWMRGPHGSGCTDPWVTEYYTQKIAKVDEVFFIVGSDVIGPMGKSLVPVAGKEEAERFLEDHLGERIVTADEVTLELLKEIAGKTP